MATQTLSDFVSANVIDSRDITERIAELDELLTDKMLRRDELLELETLTDEESEELETLKEELNPDADDVAELQILQEFAEECSGNAPDWEYGETIIADSHFEEYAQELAEDCGMVPKDLAWPCTHIDWEAAAEALKQDYACVTLEGNEFWIR
jgi:hypothetical protein